MNQRGPAPPVARSRREARTAVTKLTIDIALITPRIVSGAAAASMTCDGFKDPKERVDLIAYLGQMNNSTECTKR